MPNRPEFNALRNKGAARIVRLNKRMEAEERNQQTVPDKRRAFWKERGFIRQSHAASVIKNVVVLTNAQAKQLKQRSEDWPLIAEDLHLNSAG